jgi:REP element-mobilizing transposase RayT
MRTLRKNLRLPTWDYSTPGYYFITVCTRNKERILCHDPTDLRRGAQCAPGVSIPDQFPLTEIGEVVEAAINQIPEHYPFAQVDKYVIMPNHIHLIIILSNTDTHGRTLCAPTISQIMKQMKETVTKHIGFPIWQKSFHDHIIRNEPDYLRIWEYVDTNPQKWEQDCYYNKEL